MSPKIDDCPQDWSVATPTVVYGWLADDAFGFNPPFYAI
jgi:hypothetical protein